ncbi:hypothetical protein [Streptomyces griseomycini]|uniref:Uncharacterized protein n=1 Tax=Streptomyces griseomycini TaxID=66895 RepID=A0A7W7LYU3_9ACTN|nr:hypothetical protein [Streptomyces griseomycini]MBB4898995.1 hypothetical protein [Streptomyces griseomycini]GGQ06752.1 hypothetical protein GCM10010266_32850 [Streptomyces griseomycini]GGR22019.1 hypothetical protein GCM10015536_29770 [Streptomyces griseomycini]
MTAQRPDDGGTPRDRDDVPSLPEDVWQRFLTDDEHAIRASAPREPSARQRASGRWPRPPRTGDGAEQRYDAADAVGDLWHPDDPWEGPSWRDLDGRARLRRVGRVVGTAAAIALALGAWSQLSTGAGTPAEGPGDTVLQQSEDAPAELPTATSLPVGLTSPSPSASTDRSG